MSHWKPSCRPRTSTSGERGADGRRADDAVDAGGGAAGDDDGELAVGSHVGLPSSLSRARGSRSPASPPTDGPAGEGAALPRRTRTSRYGAPPEPWQERAMESGVETSKRKPGTPPALALGAMNFGKRTPDEESERIVRRALERGVRVFDTANSYNAGESERILGRALGRDRERVDARRRRRASACSRAVREGLSPAAMRERARGVARAPGHGPRRHLLPARSRIGRRPSSRRSTASPSSWRRAACGRGASRTTRPGRSSRCDPRAGGAGPRGGPW